MLIYLILILMLKAKKSLGQNFLKSNQILDKIVKTADLKTTDIVLEVGPGKGHLTQKLLEKASQVIAVEKDQRLISFLQEKFENELKQNQLKLIYEDILKINPEIFFNTPYKIVANLPYYITGQFLRKFLSSDFPPSKIVVMLQKEVAQRIISSPNKESILSLSVKSYGKPTYIATIKAKNFSPQPKVDSAILLISNISKNFFQNIDEALFFRIIKLGFGSKRKMLINNLSFVPKKELEKIFNELNIPSKTRAEDLSLESWGNLTKVIHK